MDLADDSVNAVVVERYADLLARRRGDFGERPLVLPNGHFFPDRFGRDEQSLAHLVARMQGHAGMEDIPIVTRLVHDGAPTGGGGGCGSGACATPAAGASEQPRLSDDGELWTLNVPEAELGAPVVLTTMVARALGHVFLFETSRNPSDIPQPVAVAADLAAVGLGFGPLLLEGSYIYSKSCGGPHIGRATHLSVQELAMAVALFIELHGHRPRAAEKELGVTQREALSQALDLLRSNRALVERLRADPKSVAAGGFELAETKPWLLRLFGGKSERKPKAPSFDDLAELEARLPQMAKAPRRREPTRAADDDLKALVDEAFAAPRRADAE